MQGLGGASTNTDNSSLAPSTTAIVSNSRPFTFVNGFIRACKGQSADSEQSLITGVVSTTSFNITTAGPTDGFLWSKDSKETDLPQAEQCWSSIVSWRVGYVDWYNSYIANRTWAYTISTSLANDPYITSTTIYPTNASTYTLCGPSPRVNVEPITRHTSFNTTFNMTYTAIATPTYSVSQPCAASEHYCRLWYYESNVRNVSEDLILGQCGLPAHLDEPCLIGGGPVRLIYWPVAENPVCGMNSSFVNSTSQSVPATITTLGTTFTSGSVYLSLKTLYAYYDGFFQETIGPNFSDYIVPLSSEAISTHCGMSLKSTIRRAELMCVRDSRWMGKWSPEPYIAEGFCSLACEAISLSDSREPISVFTQDLLAFDDIVAGSSC